MGKFENPKGVAARIYVDDNTILESEQRLAVLPSLSPTQLECLEQLITPVYDGNLISKQGRSELCNMGLVARWNGINFCTQDGYCVLSELGHLRDSDKFCGGKPWKNHTRKVVDLLQAASHALRSYQYGNSATDLAKGIADSIDEFLDPKKG